ncbi:unnamed protein product [Nesidiocoris tenuis]|uniref:Uncharacterized protein n=1 Tax=Nesidiocoris tenuis TaxID=355587 RepID=A0A6H5H4D5_9HEMI|nr:unnamed protein product [Nesidiocoris tenuis]
MSAEGAKVSTKGTGSNSAFQGLDGWPCIEIIKIVMSTIGLRLIWKLPAAHGAFNLPDIIRGPAGSMRSSFTSEIGERDRFNKAIPSKLENICFETKSKTMSRPTLEDLNRQVALKIKNFNITDIVFVLLYTYQITKENNVLARGNSKEILSLVCRKIQLKAFIVFCDISLHPPPSTFPRDAAHQATVTGQLRATMLCCVATTIRWHSDTDSSWGQRLTIREQRTRLEADHATRPNSRPVRLVRLRQPGGGSAGGELFTIGDGPIASSVVVHNVGEHLRTLLGPARLSGLLRSQISRMKGAGKTEY